jgi:hypothetical protein
MKRLLAILFLFVGYVSFGQSAGNDSSRYTWQKFQYGNRQPRYWADSVLRIPKDTLYSKDGIAIKQNRLFVGDGIYWHESGSGQIIAPSAGMDSITWHNTTICFYPTGQAQICFTFDQFVCYTSKNYNNTYDLFYNCNDQLLDSSRVDLTYVKAGTNITIALSGPYNDTATINSSGGSGGTGLDSLTLYRVAGASDSSYLDFPRKKQDSIYRIHFVGAGGGTITSSGVDPASFINGETPSGTINSTNLVFTLANTPVTGKEYIYLNGIRQKRTTDYTISGSTITFITAPATGNELLADYLK